MDLRTLPRWLNQETFWLLPLTERALHIAAARIGEREIRRNSSPWIDRFLSAVGLNPGYAWCASFVYWSLIAAGWPADKLPQRRKAAGVVNWARWAEQNGLLTDEPRRGDLMFWVNPDGVTGHIGFITSAVGITLKTIEGNTDGDGSREGDGVYRKSRRLEGRIRAISLTTLAERLKD